MRLFIAIPVPRSQKKELKASMNRIVRYDTIRVTAPEGYHLTLAFLGERTEGQLPEILSAVDAAAAEFSPFSLHLCRACRLSRGSVLAIRAEEGAVQASALMGRMNELLDLSPGRRIFTPHITLARMRRGSGRIPDQVLQLVDQRIGMELWCDRITVFRSYLHRTHAVYEQLYEKRLSV